MEWVACLKKSIEYVEDNLMENISSYILAGEYKGGPVPEGMVLYTF